MNHLTAYEHDTLPVCTVDLTAEKACLTPGQWERLLATSAHLPVHALQFKHRAIKLGSYCGVLPVGSDTLEILPKIYRSQTQIPENRALLLHMLSVCRTLPLAESGPALLALQQHRLLEIFIDQFCTAAFRQVHQGLLRIYVEQHSNLQVLRGRIHWPRQLRDNLVHQERLYCQYDELIEDNPYNQAIKATLQVVQLLCRANFTLQRKLRELAFIFADISHIPMTAGDVAKLPRNRLIRRYESVLQWCEWFLGMQSPDLQGGAHQATGLLFDMNQLFQDYVFQLLQRTIRRQPQFSDLRVTAERPARYLLRTADIESAAAGYFQMRPDICVFRRGHPTPIAIIDTKWKLLNRYEAGNKWGIKQSDVYQMFAYAKGYDCPQILLLYPAHTGILEEKLPQFRFNEGSAVNQDSKLQIAAIDIEKDLITFPVHPSTQLTSLLTRIVESA